MEASSILSAVKADSSKIPLDLLDAEAIEGLGKVLAFGAQKYNAHNWRGGFKYSRLIAALLRHTFAIMKGEYTDDESGLPHIDHIGCCWMFLSAHMKQNLGEDDLYFNPIYNLKEKQNGKAIDNSQTNHAGKTFMHDDTSVLLGRLPCSGENDLCQPSNRVKPFELTERK